MRQIIRIGVLVVPWLMAVALPILLFPGFADSNMGSIDFVHLLGFEFVMIPLAPLMLLRCLLANPECSVVLKILMFVVGAFCPLFIALLLARRIVRHPLGLAACWLILAGGLGNIIDRVRLGYVVDMFQFQFWESYPVFNVADMFVVVGVILFLLYYLFLYEKTDSKKARAEQAEKKGAEH